MQTNHEIGEAEKRKLTLCAKNTKQVDQERAKLSWQRVLVLSPSPLPSLTLLPQIYRLDHANAARPVVAWTYNLLLLLHEEMEEAPASIESSVQTTSIHRVINHSILQSIHRALPCCWIKLDKSGRETSQVAKPGTPVDK